MNIDVAMLALINSMWPYIHAEKGTISDTASSTRIYLQRAATNREVDIGGTVSSLQETLFDIEVGSLNDETTAQDLAIGIKEGVTLTTLNGLITSGATSITVTSAANMLLTASFVIMIDSEKMLVTNIAGSVLTVTRGYGGTTAAGHANGADVTIQGLNGYRGPLVNSGIAVHGAFVQDHTDDYIPKMLDADEGYFTAAFQAQVIHEGG